MDKVRKRKEYQTIFKTKARNNNLSGNLIIKCDDKLIEGIRSIEVIRHNKPWSIEQ